MNATDFRAAIKQLGMSQNYTARFFGYGQNAGQRWAKDGTPPIVGQDLTLMLAIQTNMHIRDVPEWINLMIGRKMEKRKKATKISP